MYRIKQFKLKPFCFNFNFLNDIFQLYLWFEEASLFLMLRFIYNSYLFAYLVQLLTLKNKERNIVSTVFFFLMYQDLSC